MYKFDRIESLAEMKEICFFIKAINEGKKEDKYNLDDLMIFKNFLYERYNLEIPLSKLYLFVEKINYLNNGNNEIPSVEEIDNIVKCYLENQKELLQAQEIKIIKAELNLRDNKYNLGDYGYKSAKDLTKDISINKKIYYSYNNWLLLASFAIALFLGSATFLMIGAFAPIVLTYFASKPQEVILLLLIIAVLTYAFYFLLDFIYRNRTWHLKAQIDGYYKYQSQIDNDYNALLEAKKEYSKKLAEFSINGIEFSEKLLYNYLTLNDGIDIASYSSFTKKYSSEDTYKVKPIKPAKTGIVLSKKEQNYKWQSDKSSKIEKENINSELVARVNNLALVLKENKVSTANLAKSISELYCNDLSVERRKERINNASSKYELNKNYLDTIKKIEEYEELSFFDKSKIDKTMGHIIMLEESEKLSFKEDLGIMCDRIEKAYNLGLINETKYKSYKIIKEGLDSNVIEGVNLNNITKRSQLAKLYVNLYDVLSIYDILN